MDSVHLACEDLVAMTSTIAAENAKAGNRRLSLIESVFMIFNAWLHAF